MKYPMVWDGKQWRKSTKEEYENEVVKNFPMYGTANYYLPDVWDLPVVDTNITTGSKVAKCGDGKSVQFRFSCARNTEAAQVVRAYKLGLDRSERAGVRFNYTKSGSCFVFETTFCGSTSALEKFLKRLECVSSIKSLQVRMRDEATSETSAFKKFHYNNIIINVVRYLRDNLTIEDYNNIIVKKLKTTPDKSIYKLKVTF